MTSPIDPTHLPLWAQGNDWDAFPLQFDPSPGEVNLGPEDLEDR